MDDLGGFELVDVLDGSVGEDDLGDLEEVDDLVVEGALDDPEKEEDLVDDPGSRFFFIYTTQ